MINLTTKWIKFVCILLLFSETCSCIYEYRKCTQSAVGEIPFVVNYAVWRGWHQALIHTVELPLGCRGVLVRLVKLLCLNGISVAVDVCNSCTAKHRLGVVIFPVSLRKNYTYRLSNTVDKIIKLGLHTASYDWLLLSRSEYDIKLINSILNATAIRFDQNIIVVYPSSTKESSDTSSRCCDENFIYRSINRLENYNTSKTMIKKHVRDNFCPNGNSDCNENVFKRSKNMKNLKFGKSAPLLRSGMTNTNYFRYFQMVNASEFSLRKEFIIWSQLNTFNQLLRKIHVVQYFKVRTNSTLYASYLGAWSRERSLSQVKVPYSVEERNFLGEEFTVGRSNSTGDGIMEIDDDRSMAPVLIDDLLDFMNSRLNITSVTRYYGKLGFRTYEGAWTGLLGALMDSSVDVALEPVTALTSQYQDMDFIFPIAETMCSIYIRHQETSAVRDIFLAPFSARLLVSVAAVAVVAAGTVGAMSRIAVNIRKEIRTMSCIESLLWSVGILCQQGGQWTPSVPAASIVLIICLLFAVVTYNAYAAFITSVLSVRVPSVATVSDVLNSPNFKIGYIRNGADQMYLMSTKDVQLNAFYIRGYSEAENLVSSAEEGLARAARQDYAFFTGRLSARSTLRKLSQARGRCALRELPVPSTRAQLAFPLPKKSPYARPILLSLLQLRSSGTLSRLEAALVPALPQCAPPSGFASARAADVRSALLLLLLGLLASLAIGTFASLEQGLLSFFGKNVCRYEGFGLCAIDVWCPYISVIVRHVYTK